MEQYWRDFLLYYAGKSNRGTVRTGDGVEAAWVNSALLVNNGTYLTKPVGDASDLRMRCREAAADASPHGLPWLFFLYEPMVADSLVPDCDAIFEEEGYHFAAGLRVMTGDCSALLPPVRPLPAVEIRRVNSREETRKVMHLNCLAYGMPVEIGDSVVESDAYFSDKEREFGYVAYVDGGAVSTSSILVLGDVLYVEAVATDPGHQKKGYAEAVMRHALAEASQATGLRKTALDASDMGRPLYAQMGYQAWCAWRYYVKG